jgi:hypothetical protein
MREMKRTMAAYLTAAALAAGLAVANFTPAACQTMVEDELIKAPVSIHPVELEVWVDKGEDAVYRDGEEVGIRFRVSDDCYVVIYDIDTEGFLSLLSPMISTTTGLLKAGASTGCPTRGRDMSFSRRARPASSTSPGLPA